MKIRTRQPAGNPAEDLPLLAWAASVRERRPIPLATAWLRRRHPLSARRATLIAMLAGLDTGGGR